MPFALKRRLLYSNGDTIDLLAIEAEAKMEKLRERIAIDEGRVERNYKDLQLLSQLLEDDGQQMMADRQAESAIRESREALREALAACRSVAKASRQRAMQEVEVLREAIDAREKETGREREEREGSMLRTIE